MLLKRSSMTLGVVREAVTVAGAIEEEVAAEELLAASVVEELPVVCC